ncbi:MAG: magnesium transporter [Aquitalea sp.]|nr:magnesium transporter [Aquitalea sp.]
MTVVEKKQTAERLSESLAELQRLIALLEQSSPDGAALQILQQRLQALHPADIATILEALPLAGRLLLWAHVTPQQNGPILLEVSSAVRGTLIDAMPAEALLTAVRQLHADGLAELAADLPRQVVYEVMGQLEEHARSQLLSALSYPEDSIGALMDAALVKIRADVSCEVVLRYLRRFDALPHQTDKIFVLDANETLCGVLPLRSLLVADSDAMVAEVMATEVVSFLPDDDAHDAALAFERYDLVSAPVVDERGRLIGRLTVDEMVDVMREESDSEVLNLAGLKEEEDLFAPVMASVKNRWAWLAINLGTAFVASRVIGSFEQSISQLVALAALMPIVAGIGGNAGNQTITMIVRALAMGHMQPGQAWRLWRKELGVSIINGLIWGSAIGLIAWALYGRLSLGLVMLAAMTLNLMLAASMGVLIPSLMQRRGRDPALGSSVLITACTDSGGFFIFLGLATIFLL